MPAGYPGISCWCGVTIHLITRSVRSEFFCIKVKKAHRKGTHRRLTKLRSFLAIGRKDWVFLFLRWERNSDDKDQLWHSSRWKQVLPMTFLPPFCDRQNSKVTSCFPQLTNLWPTLHTTEKLYLPLLSRLPLCLSFPFLELSLLYTYYLGSSKWWWKVISPSQFLFPHLWNKTIILNNCLASHLFNLKYLWLLYLSCSPSPWPSHRWHFVITSSQHLNGPSFVSHSSYLAF